MHVLELTLSPAQAKKLIKGNVVQLSKKALQGGANWIALHPASYKKAMKARKAGKGIRLKLDPSEINASGEGLWDLLKKGGKKAKQFYDKHVKPTVGPMIKKGAKEALRLVEKGIETMAPELTPIVEAAHDHWGDRLIDEVGRRTGAYGMIRPEIMGYPKRGGEVGALLSSNHPAYNPLPRPSLGTCPHCMNTVSYGGSFRAP